MCNTLQLVSSDVTSCKMVDIYRRFRGSCCPHKRDGWNYPSATTISVDETTMMIEGKSLSETLGHIYQNTRRHIPGGGNLHSHLCENLKGRTNAAACVHISKNRRGNVRVTWHWHETAVCVCLCVRVCRARGGVDVGAGARARACTCPRVALLIQQAMRRIILSFAASLAPPHISTLSHKRRDFRKNVTEYKMCILIFSTSFIWNIFHHMKNSARCHKCENVKYSLFLSDFNENWIFWTGFFLKKLKYQVSSKFVQWEASCSMRTDRRMYVTKLIVALRTRLKRNQFNCLNVSEFQALDKAPVKHTYVLRVGRSWQEKCYTYPSECPCTNKCHCTRITVNAD